MNDLITELFFARFQAVIELKMMFKKLQLCFLIHRGAKKSEKTVPDQQSKRHTVQNDILRPSC
jgi:hypothetical protein